MTSPRTRRGSALPLALSAALACAAWLAAPLASPPDPGRASAAEADGPARTLQSAVTITRTKLPERYRLESERFEANVGGGDDPAGVAVGEDGMAYVAEPRSNRIRVWRTVGGEGGLLTPVPPYLNGSGQLSAPEDLAVDTKAGRAYVADTGNGRVAVLDIRGGALLSSWPVEGRPRGIAQGPDGRLYVSDAAGGRVRVYDTQGAHQADWGAPGRGPGQLDTPLGLAIGAKDGLLYVADSGNQRVQWFGADGVVAGQLLLDNSAGPGGAPRDVFVNDKGQIHVAVERGVLRYNSPTAYVETIRPILTILQDGTVVHKLDNHDGVRGVGYQLKAGWAVSLDPGLWRGDGLDAYPARWFPGYGRDGHGPLREPYRIAGDGRGAAILDAKGGLRAMDAQGRLGQEFGPLTGGEEDLSAQDLALLEACFAALVGNTAHLLTTDMRNCPSGELEVLDEAQRSQRDRTGELVPDGRWWNRAIGLDIGPTPSVAVLDAGKMRLVLRSLVPIAWGQLVGAVQLQPTTRPHRSFVDLAVDGRGTTWILAKDGGLLPIDRRGRDGEEIRLDLLGRGADALALGPEPSFFVLATDGWVFKFSERGETLAAWPARVDGQGRAIGYTDLTVDEAGKVYLTDRLLDRVMVYAPDAGPGDPPDGADGPPCGLLPGKVAAPSRLNLGETTEVTLSVDADCGGAHRQLDVVFVLDAGCDMAGERLAKLHAAAGDLMAALDQERDHVGLVSFAVEVSGKEGGARLLLPLTPDRGAAAAALAGFKTSCLPLGFLGITPTYPMDIAGGLRAGQEALFGPAGRPQAGKVLVLLSPRSATDRNQALYQARSLWQAGVRVYSVSVGQDAFNAAKDGPDQGLVAALTSRAAGFQHADAPSALPAILRDLGRGVADRVLLRDITVVDRIPANMRLVPGSVSPPAEQPSPGVLRWRFRDVGWEGIPKLRFRLEPLQVGRHPTNIEATGVYTDGLGYAGSLVFPVPYVEVIGPTPPASPSPEASPSLAPTYSPVKTATIAPSATLTPPPGATRAPVPIYLPFLLHEQCLPKSRPVDVVLAIDTSSSMLGAKLDAAKAAANAFLDQLDLGRDHAAVVGFDSVGRLAQPLTADRTGLSAAIAGLTPAVGTRIDEGLWTALTELTGPRRRKDADAVIVLLTDGRPQQGTEGRIRQAATLTAQLSVSVYAIGLGEDVLPEVLREVTGAADRVYIAPTEAGLADIYRKVARLLPCR